MLTQAFTLFNFDHGQPPNVLDLTGAFGPYSAEVGIGLAIAILAVAVLTGIIDSWNSKRQAAQVTVVTQTTEQPVISSCDPAMTACKAA